MNQKNALGINNCFEDLDNPIDLFKKWYHEAKKLKLMTQMLSHWLPQTRTISLQLEWCC